METYTPTGASFNSSIHEFETTDRAHADVLNVPVEELAENDAYLKKETDKIGDLEELHTAEKENLVSAINEAVEGGGIVYGFHINSTEGTPASKVTYLAGAVGMTPAKMDYANSKFSYGSWQDAFFMPRPCMLKSDGTVDYYLDPTNYAKKEDGVTASDVGNTAYNGNAMMEWGQNGKKIWMKIIPDGDGKGASFYIADRKEDENYHDYPFHNSAGESMAHFYTAIYNGSLDSNGKLRSLSGQALMKSKTAAEEITAALANNPADAVMWNTELHGDILLINALLILMAKTTDTQTAFGEGLHTNGTEAINDGFRTGIHDAKGLFWGTNAGTIASGSYGNAVKVFGMENWWGLQWRRYQGHIMVDGVQKVKNTYGKEDGSNVVGYNLTGDGYKNTGAANPSGTSGGYISQEHFSEDGMFPEVASGTSSTHYCDGLWFNNSGTRVPLRGGLSDHGAHDGALCVTLTADASHASWIVGAALVAGIVVLLF